MGAQKDSWDIDYEATLNSLQAARQSGAAHFVLLSAICVQKPLLVFQKAKLKFEAALQVCYHAPPPPGVSDALSSEGMHFSGRQLCNLSTN